MTADPNLSVACQSNGVESGKSRAAGTDDGCKFELLPSRSILSHFNVGKHMTGRIDVPGIVERGYFHAIELQRFELLQQRLREFRKFRIGNTLQLGKWRAGSRFSLVWERDADPLWDIAHRRAWHDAMEGFDRNFGLRIADSRGFDAYAVCAGSERSSQSSFYRKLTSRNSFDIDADGLAVHFDGESGNQLAFRSIDLRADVNKRRKLEGSRRGRKAQMNSWIRMQRAAGCLPARGRDKKDDCE